MCSGSRSVQTRGQGRSGADGCGYSDFGIRSEGIVNNQIQEKASSQKGSGDRELDLTCARAVRSELHFTKS